MMHPSVHDAMRLSSEVLGASTVLVRQVRTSIFLERASHCSHAGCCDADRGLGAGAAAGEGRRSGGSDGKITGRRSSKRRQR